MRFTVFVIVLLAGITVKAQKNLSGSIQHSHFTYVYKIDKREASALAKAGLKNISDKYLHTLVDSFPMQEDAPELSAGVDH